VEETCAGGVSGGTEELDRRAADVRPENSCMIGIVGCRHTQTGIGACSGPSSSTALSGNNQVTVTPFDEGGRGREREKMKLKRLKNTLLHVCRTVVKQYSRHSLGRFNDILQKTVLLCKLIDCTVGLTLVANKPRKSERCVLARGVTVSIKMCNVDLDRSMIASGN